MRVFPAIILAILLGACAENENQVKDLRDPDLLLKDEHSETDENTPSDVLEDTISKKVIVPATNSEWSYEVTLISENNWGYQIFQKGTMVINQTSIPSIQGVEGFDTEEKAELTAKYILNKVENGVFPPTVNKEDLENLGVLRY